MARGRWRLLGLIVGALAVLALGTACSPSGGGPAPAGTPSSGASPSGTPSTPSGPSSSTPTGTPPGPSPTPGSPSASPTTGGKTDLLVVTDDGAGSTHRWRLTCDPAGGDHPDPAAACKALAEHGRQALPPVPGNVRCSMVYGGPETATVTGTWRGQPISSRFSRTNGCEVSRWKRMVGLLPAPGA